MVQMALNVQKSSPEILDDKSRCIIQGSSVKRVETESTTRSTLHEFTRQESDSSEAESDCSSEKGDDSVCDKDWVTTKIDMDDFESSDDEYLPTRRKLQTKQDQTILNTHNFRLSH